MDWQTQKLADLCDFSNGLWTGKKPPYVRAGVVRNTNFSKNHTLDCSDIVYLDVEEKQFAKRKLQYGDLILEKSGGGPKQPVGRVIVFDKISGNYSFSNFTSVIRVKDADTLDFDFLHKYLSFFYTSGRTEKIQSHSTGIRNLKFEDYKKIAIPIPTIQEQRWIVAALADAFAEIEQATANAQTNLQNARAIFESRLEFIFANQVQGWTETKLGEVCEIYQPKTISSKDMTLDGAHPVFGANGLIGAYDKYNHEEPQLLLTCRGATCGSINISLPKSWITGNAMVVRPTTDELDRRFVEYFFRGACDFSGIITGAAQPQITRQSLAPTAFFFPPLPEQHRIVAELDALAAQTHRLEAIYRQKLAQLAALKQAILQKAFAGDLRPKGAAA